MAGSFHTEQESYLQHSFEKRARELTFSDPLKGLLCEEFIDLCRDFDFTHIQESWSWRNTHLARELAVALINEAGELYQPALNKAILFLEENLYSLGPDRYNDADRQEHMLNLLKRLQQSGELQKIFKRIHRPLGHQLAEKVIRETLFLPEGIEIKDKHARAAALSALLTSLRQNVGSCFATAPAILIQQEQPEQFLADIIQLFGTGKLSRTFEGIEYAVPMSASWGVGDLFRPLFLFNLGAKPLHTLSFSPGLQAAFAAAGLLDAKTGREEKREACEELLNLCPFLHRAEDNPFLALNPEQIIKTVLLKKFGITEEDMARFRDRSFQGPLAEVVIQVPIAESKKAQGCTLYLKAYDKAKAAFKALTDNALLKSWEFTLASLSESKADFAKWNLYASLGVRPEEPYGIGESLFRVITEKIEKINQAITELQSNYDHLFAQAKYLEGRISRAATEKEAGWVQAEYQVRRQEIDRALNERDELYEKGQKLQGIYPKLINFYGEKIRDYFQEVYDAEMHDVSGNPYDDSPAGFRLMYKHGRSNTALWTSINSSTEYIQHLTAFFVSTEIELSQDPEFAGLHNEISELVTAAILAIKRPEFLESSLYRLAKTYREPLIEHPIDNLAHVKRKPWAYTSGGTMSTLVSCYWGSAQKPSESKRWVESENELLAFLIDTVKELPHQLQKKFRANPHHSLFAFSPTHAFLCKPGWPVFKEGWESDVYTYTWIRDHWSAPQKKFLDAILLNSRMIDLLVHKLLHFIPLGYKSVVKQVLRNLPQVVSPTDFRESVIRALSYEKWLQGGRLTVIAEELDSLLYQSLPLFPDHELKEHLTLLFQNIEGVDAQMYDQVMANFATVEEGFEKYKILTAKDLKNIAQGLLITTTGRTRTRIFFHKKITDAMRRNGLCYPEPLIFADTNWVKNVFGFVINPGTRELELWRFDNAGSEGRPMSMWKRYLNGSEQGEWGIYTGPRQYGM